MTAKIRFDDDHVVWVSFNEEDVQLEVLVEYEGETYTGTVTLMDIG